MNKLFLLTCNTSETKEIHANNVTIKYFIAHSEILPLFLVSQALRINVVNKICNQIDPKVLLLSNNLVKASTMLFIQEKLLNYVSFGI